MPDREITCGRAATPGWDHDRYYRKSIPGTELELRLVLCRPTLPTDFIHLMSKSPFVRLDAGHAVSHSYGMTLTHGIRGGSPAAGTGQGFGGDAVSSRAACAGLIHPHQHRPHISRIWDLCLLTSAPRPIRVPGSGRPWPPRDKHEEPPFDHLLQPGCGPHRSAYQGPSCMGMCLPHVENVGHRTLASPSITQA